MLLLLHFVARCSGAQQRLSQNMLLLVPLVTNCAKSFYTLSLLVLEGPLASNSMCDPCTLYHRVKDPRSTKVSVPDPIS